MYPTACNLRRSHSKKHPVTLALKTSPTEIQHKTQHKNPSFLPTVIRDHPSKSSPTQYKRNDPLRLFSSSARCSGRLTTRRPILPVDETRALRLERKDHARTWNVVHPPAPWGVHNYLERATWHVGIERPTKQLAIDALKRRTRPREATKGSWAMALKMSDLQRKQCLVIP